MSGALAVVGGCGHVGLPLGLAFADSGLDVVLYDIDEDAIDMVRAGKMPFSRDANGFAADSATMREVSTWSDS